MDSPWNEDIDYTAARDAEWTKLSSEFTDAGYREGITAGKDAAAQAGFDAGFADVGAPLGRALGVLRGRSAAMLSFFTMQHQGDTPSSSRDVADRGALLDEARAIAAQLGRVRFSDIEPRDVDAEAHAREHLEGGASDVGAGSGMGVDEEAAAGGQPAGGVVDLSAALNAGAGGGEERLTGEDVKRLGARLGVLCERLGFGGGSAMGDWS